MGVKQQGKNTMGVKQQETSTSPIFSSAARRYLFGPGPSMVHPRVYEALSKPIVGHLDPYFFQVMGDIQQLLKPVFGTKDGVTTVISGTGSAGMEAAVSNFVEPGAKLAVFASGYFCDRISEMGKRQGAQVVRFEKPWGKTFATEEATEFIRRESRKWSLTFTRKPRRELCNPGTQSAPPLTKPARWSSLTV
jgi:aspartate aminotransferase-like enzyme